MQGLKHLTYIFLAPLTLSVQVASGDDDLHNPSHLRLRTKRPTVRFASSTPSRATIPSASSPKGCRDNRCRSGNPIRHIQGFYSDAVCTAADLEQRMLRCFGVWPQDVTRASTTLTSVTNSIQDDSKAAAKCI